MASTFEIDLLLIGFASATCSVLFSTAAGRRLCMAIALACAVGVVVISIMGLYRILLFIALAYLLHDWWRTRRGTHARPRSARAVTGATLPPPE